MEKPKYLQIKDMIMENIAGKNPGTAIPSEREISNTYDASRMTVRRAIEELVEDGYLYREPNVGTFVAEHKKRNERVPFILHDSKTEKTTYKILYFNTYFDAKVDKEVAENLEIRAGETTIRIVRLVESGDDPVCVEDIYIAREMVDQNNFHDMSSYLDFDRYIEQGGIAEVFVPTIVPTQYAKLLNLKMNTPIIRIDNLISKKNGSPFIFVQSYYNPNKKKIMIRL